MSSPNMAKRSNGVCQGSLWRHTTDLKTSRESSRVYEYCVLVGSRLCSYESRQMLDRGRPPVVALSVVGASAVSTDTSSFRLVTNQGTHVHCTAPTSSCRDLWLNALNAGLERRLTDPTSEEPLLTKVKPPSMMRIKKTDHFCHSCGKLERNEFPLVHEAAPLFQYGIEERVDLCAKCANSQIVLDHVQLVKELYASSRQEQRALLEARKICLEQLVKGYCEQMDEENSYMQHVSPKSSWILNQILKQPEFMGCVRVSPTLGSLCDQFSQGILGTLEFVESLDLAVGRRDPALSMLKKEAFRAAGDMGTAMKLLLENALPKQRSDTTELLTCILEFFLDLAEEDELPAVAFFWPQLCHLHLRMLPATDVAELERLELFEDFLLTIATRHSIQLAIELIWSHTADLEDASSPTSLPCCTMRRGAVVRFLCELESLLFDFESGWGGGSVTVGSILSPSPHQVRLLGNCMQDIQIYRRQNTSQLSRSVRLERITKAKESYSPDLIAQEALRIAKNADYLSSHLAFTKRLCDIAERLRFLPLGDRANALRADLSKLNASGGMGGDPLNRVQDTQMRVVRVPTTEGHVFRSKERTPVLLLMEVVEESTDDIVRSVSKDDLVLVDEEQPSAQENAVSVVMNQESEDKEESTESPTSAEEESPVDVARPDDAQSPKSDEKSNADANDTFESQVVDTMDTKPTKSSSEETGSAESDKEESARKLTPTESSEDFESTHTDEASIEAMDEAPSTPPSSPTRTERKTSEDAVSFDLEGSTSWDHGDQPVKHTLRRFDSPKTRDSKILTPTPDKLAVEALVTNVVAKQLQLPNLITTEEEGSSAGREHEAGEESSGSGGQEDSSPGDSTNTEEKDEETTQQTIKMETKKATALGGLSLTRSDSNSLSKTGDARREVLNSIMMKGMSGSNAIATDTATAVRRHLQDLERRRAVELLLTAGTDENSGENGGPEDAGKIARKELMSLNIRSASVDVVDGEEVPTKPSEEDETMEAVRLLLIQYRVAKGELSADAAAKALAPNRRRSEKSRYSASRQVWESKTQADDPRELPQIDAGDLDSRLVGCGPLPRAVLQALTLWKGGMVTNGELLTLVKKDLEYVRQNAELEESKDKLSEDSAFWGRFAFGERWAEKQSRIAATSPEARKSGWHLMGVIVKSNDDLRQEAFVMQLIELCKEAFQEAGLELWLYPYRILSTGRTTGIIEMVRNAMSFDALKKRKGYGAGGLREHLQRMTQYTADPGESFKTAQQNFVRSLAAYSLLSYLFMFKDRHNGNILLDTAGHVIHIDFGFVFGVAPGGNFSLELSTPFKLTEEMIEVMDGLRSSLFSEFVTLFCCGFLALQAHCDTFLTIVEISCANSTFKCFEGRDSEEILSKMRERFCPDLGKEETIAYALDIIKEATQSYGTKQYDYFQYLSQGIAA